MKNVVAKWISNEDFLKNCLGELSDSSSRRKTHDCFGELSSNSPRRVVQQILPKLGIVKPGKKLNFYEKRVKR